MSEFLTVSQVADGEGVRPRDISDLLYGRRVDVSRCPLVSGRRLIPRDLLPAIRAALRSAGKLPERVGA
jgi:hypothetical protein